MCIVCMQIFIHTIRRDAIYIKQWFVIEYYIRRYSEFYILFLINTLYMIRIRHVIITELIWGLNVHTRHAEK